MNILEDFLVVEHSDNIPETYRGTVLLLKPGHCEPGYTRLELYRNTPGNSLERNLVKSRWETIFGSDKAF